MSKSGFYIFVLFVLIYAGCRRESGHTADYIQLRGRTMGTTYSIRYASHGIDFQTAIDSLLKEVNMAVSTYIPESTISKFNRTGVVRLVNESQVKDTERHPLLIHFTENLRVAAIINAKSDGSFDPTVGPLVNLWGFGSEGRAPSRPDSIQIDSMLTLVGMHHIYPVSEGNERFVKKDIPGVQLDFSALAKGYGVDVVSEFLVSHGVSDFFVEIGGEVRTGGVSSRGDKWRVGINQPEPEADVSELYTRVFISNRSMATSGNYRNYYVVDGLRVWHTINPKTGYPEINPVLSATIVHGRCIIADALATACMVMGPEDGLKLVAEFAGAEAFILYSDPEGQIAELMTPGFKEFLIDTK
jgi:FAD:protein FMN transferase